MIAGIASALSGIQTGGKILSIGAHNIANAQTTRTAEGGPYRRKEVVFGAEPARNSEPCRSTPGALDKDVRPGPQIFSNEDPSTLREGSNVDLAEEIISNLQAVNLIEANIASVRI